MGSPLPAIYFIRHGQAGLRGDYDRLSPLGREQARRLGRYLVREGCSFDRIIAGGLRRQRETASIVCNILARARLGPPDITDDPGWSEFDLDQVYSNLAPQIAAEDAEFRQQYEELIDRMRSVDSAVHRQWAPADTRVVRAWIEGRYRFEGESWEQFLDRIGGAFQALAASLDGRRAAVFTSATPAAVVVAGLFGSRRPSDIMRLAGAALNTNMTVLDGAGEALSLACFNAVPHLEERRFRTHR